jgi:hypothetical protein
MELLHTQYRYTEKIIFWLPSLVIFTQLNIINSKLEVVLATELSTSSLVVLTINCNDTVSECRISDCQISEC